MRILLAPMEGLLDHVLRDALTRFTGIDLCVAEFIRVTQSALPRRTFLRTVPELSQQSQTPTGVPVRVQLLGSDPHWLAINAARVVTMSPQGVDLNFGCPAKTVNNHGGGAVLLQNPEKLLQIVSQVRQMVPPAIPVTAKMRLGYADTELALDCARAIAGGGATELVVHARTRAEGYRPPAHWEWIGRIAEVVPVPVVANGEIWTVADYQRCCAESGVVDVMLGRGMVVNPGLAREIRGGPAVSWAELWPLFALFWQQVQAGVLPRHQAGRLKQWLHYLMRQYPEAELAFTGLRLENDPERLWQGFCMQYAPSSPLDDFKKLI